MANYFSNQLPKHADRPLQQYGAAAPLGKARPGRSGRLNFGAMVLCLFLPWLLFCMMFGVMSFSMHYKDKTLCFFCVFVGFAVAAVMAKLAWDSVSSRDSGTDPTWFFFLAAGCFFAWAAGVTLGDLNFFYNMEPFYDTSNLNAYPSVDPSKMPGQQVMDAGQMTFVAGSKLDVKKGMAFHNLDTYCVAPIVNGKTQPSYDFWAVGMNCCAGIVGDFACGEYNNPAATSGLRVMREDQRTFFRLAVKQAEASFSIKAKHPLFFHWMQDPGAELSAYQDEGFKYYLLGVYSFFALMLFLVIVAAVFFST